MSISFDGIVSGYDTTAMIEAILDVAAIPQDSMKASRDEYEAELEAVAGLSNRLKDLQAALEEIDTFDELSSLTAKSTSKQIVATAESTAAPGTYNIEVTSLAQNEVEASQSFADKNADGAIAEGKFTVTYAGVTSEITVDTDTSSLADVAAALDDVDGISAYVVDTGDAANPYRLVVQGEDTGTDHTIEFDMTGLTGGTGAVLAFTEEESALNAEMEINGIAVSSQSNTVEAIPGLSLELSAITDGVERVTVEQDLDATVSKIQNFVDAYNAVVDYYDVGTVYNTEEGLKGGLIGDSTARRVMDGLSDMVSSSYDVGGGYSLWAQLGISTQQDGTLKLDTDELKEALEADFDGALKLFTEDGGPGKTMIETIRDVYVDEDNGTLAYRQESLEDSIAEQEDRIADFDDYLAGYEQRLRDQFTNMEIVLGDLQVQLGALSSLSTINYTYST